VAPDGARAPLDDLLQRMDELAADMRAQRAAGTTLDADAHAAVTAAYIEALRCAGWLQHVAPEALDSILEVVVVTDKNGGRMLDVESNVTDASWYVPGWGVTETDPGTVGRNLAEDELELLEAAREEGEITGWE
jgi:hypothetical protein